MGFIEWATLGGGDLVLSIANLVLVLIALTLVLRVSCRIRGKIGRKFLVIAFIVLTIKILFEVLNEIGIATIGASDLYVKLAETIFLVLVIIYFKGIKVVINNIDSGRIAKRAKKKE